MVIPAPALEYLISRNIIFNKIELLAYRVALQIKEVIDIGSFDQSGCAALLAISISFTILILAGSFHCG
jgi:hypothetical protein